MACYMWSNFGSVAYAVTQWFQWLLVSDDDDITWANVLFILVLGRILEFPAVLVSKQRNTVKAWGATLLQLQTGINAHVPMMTWWYCLDCCWRESRPTLSNDSPSKVYAKSKDGFTKNKTKTKKPDSSTDRCHIRCTWIHCDVSCSFLSTGY